MDLEAKISGVREKIRQIDADLEVAQKDALELQDESTEELERSIAGYETLNAKVRSNMDRAKAVDEAHTLGQQYDAMTEKIEEVRQQKRDLLNGANLPLPDLGVEGGELTYQGKRWDCMSSADQLRVATAIVRALNPRCGFVLLDKLEQMDLDTMRSFGAWLEAEDLQVIATRVSTGSECSVIIEDGQVATDTNVGRTEPQPQPQTKTWKEGVF